MAYAAWVVIAGEQPTTSKWNILGTNDSSFNDGTGIATGAITSAKISGIDRSLTTTDSNPYKFRAYLGSAQNTGNPLDTYSRILYDTETFDTNSNFDSTGTKGTYTVPVSGFYFFLYVTNVVQAGADGYEAALFVNGSLYSRAHRDSVNTLEIGYTGVEFTQFTATDTVDVRVSSSTSRAMVTGTARTFFAGFLHSRT